LLLAWVGVGLSVPLLLGYANAILLAVLWALYMSFVHVGQPRLDWQIWFAAMSVPQREPWTVHLVWKLLHNDPGARSLLGNDPFADGPPRYIRARYYRYEFAPPGDGGRAWWKRTLLGEWLPPLSVNDPRLRRFLADYGWLPPRPP
ncbi:MAG TPA: lipase maturation factor family protein, partial [Candidatus Binatia bacterium]|nr:lipase maturation factor family protein [Candidatus Binatia bacterium]